MKLILTHPTANANVRAVLDGFEKANALYEFRTSVATFPGNFLGYLSKLPGFSEFKRRGFSPAVKEVTHTYPWFELGRMLASKLKFDSLIQHETGRFSIDSVYRNFDEWVASSITKRRNNNVASAVYAYEDGALATFKKARSLGIQCLYDLPIGYWLTAQRLLSKELERWPDWAATLTGFNDSQIKLDNKDEELKLADHIFVASSFTASTLKDYPGKLAPVSVIPYGFPPVGENRNYSSLSSRPLKVLFVGGLSQRKGIADLFSAVDNIGKSIELTVVGRKLVNNCLPLNEALVKHKWIPSLPHAEVLKLMRENDVLVFPSLFEGFGLVITEAMSQGTPVITTERTAGPDLIRHGENGWLVNAGSSAALQSALEDILLHPEILAENGRLARESAKKRPWAVYGQELVEAVSLISK
jgi:glycosyltransferase involved in cell wall biosynthesis